MKDSMVTVEGMTYKIGNRFLLSNINWEIKKGERWIVFGLNGSGKTTLLSAISGYGRFSDGKLEVFGKTYNEANRLELRKKIGFVSSSFFDKYYREESVLSIILSGVNGTLGLSEQLTDQDVIAARELLQKLGLDWSKNSQPFSELSKGERQKVLIARAMIGKPELLILDEAGTGLDVHARENLLQMIRKLCKEDTTIIHVTHYIEEILPEFDRALLIRDGKIYQKGSTEELFCDEVMSDFLQHPLQIHKQGQRYMMQFLSEEEGSHADE